MLNVPRDRFTWKLRTRSLPLGDRTLIMGIVNVTPDSFSDGGDYVSISVALAHALRLIDAGADIIDIGGESTRPGSGAGTPTAIPEQEEQERVLPLLDAVLYARPGAIISVDTYRASTAREALKRGAEIVNDVSGMQWDARMADVCASTRCGVVAMHTLGLPSEWAVQKRLHTTEITPLVLRALRTSASQLLLAGCDRQSIVLDPGFGFGKRGDENWVLLRELARLSELRFPLLAGLSRKSFLRTATSALPAHADRGWDELDSLTAAANCVAAIAGAHVVRTHNVAATKQAVAVADTLRSAASESS
jgi:dihydropteroate synthase